MELYKNTEWKKVAIGNEYINIPLDVERETLIKLITKIKDGTHDSFKDAKDSDAKLLLSAKNIKNSQLVFGNNERKISKGDYEKIIKNGFPQKGDLLFTIVGTIGESMIWDKEHPEAFQRSVSFIRVNEKLNNKYLDYYLKSSLAKNEISKKTKVGAQPGIYLNDLKSLDILIYSITEQNAIASLLSSQESIIQKIKNLIANLEKRNQFMINELLSGRLRIKKENGHTVLFKNPDDNWQNIKMNGENVKIPKDWYKSNLKKQSNIQSEKPKNNLQYLEIGDIDVRTKKYNLNGKEKTKASAMKFVPLNTLLISTVRPTRLGFTVTEEDLNVSSAFVKITSKTQEFLTFQLYTIDYLRFLESNQNGATYPTIKEDVLLSFEFGMPPEHEINFISKVLKELFIEKEKYEKILEKEEKTFTFLLDELMSGKLRIKI